jgi:signal transduction histidine kinase/CheY-like chemotaxis protein
MADPTSRAIVPLRQRLLIIAAAGIVPLAIAAGIGLSIIAYHQWLATQDKTLEVARLTGAAVELEIDRSLATLKSLAVSPLLDIGDMANYELLIQRVLEVTPSWHSVTLATPDRVSVVHIVEPESEFQPGTEGIETFSTVVATGKPVVGYLARDPSGQWGVPLRMPVIRDGELLYVLSAMLKPETIERVLASQRLPTDWVISVFDGRRTRIARNLKHAEFIGKDASPSLAELLGAGRSEDIGVTYTMEGAQSSTAFVKLPASGWTVAVGLSTASIRAAVIRDFKFYGAGVAGSLLFALITAWLAARSINVPMRGLREAAERVGRGGTPELPDTNIREIHALGQALLSSARAQQDTEAERQRTLDALVEAQDDLRQQVSDLQRVHRLSSELLQFGELKDQLHAVLSALCELHGSGAKGLASLCEDGARYLQVQTAIGFSDTALDRLWRIRAGEGACGLAMRSNQRVVITDTETDSAFIELRDLARAEGIRAVHSTPMRSSDGEILGVLSVHMSESRAPTEREIRLSDLCAQLCALFVERTLAEDEARHSEQRLQVALDSAAVPFSILVPVRDPLGTVVDFVWEYVNRAAADVLRRPSDEVIGHRMLEETSEIWAAPALFQTYVDVLQGGRARDWEMSHPRPDGEPQWLHMMATPFNGKVAVWWSDITQRKAQEEQQLAADRRKDEFIAILAHELRNPLAPIQQATMISRSPAATEGQKRWSQEVIERQVKHMALLLDDLLDISRITRGKLELKKTRLELRTAIDAALETSRPHLQAKDHQLHIDVPSQPIYVQADPIRLAQIVTNLLTNAARYTEPGGDIHLTASVEGEQAVVEVRDNGIGIPAEHLDSIFEMFSQVRSKRATQESGLGIGLSLSRGVAMLHGGSLTAASEGAGRGSRFTLRLPLAAAAEDQPLRIVRSAPLRDHLRVVVSDDNRDAADTLADFLKLEGHEVAVAYDGEQALQQYERLRPEVVLLDIGMPKLDGYEVARRIRAQTTGAQPLLIALTGWGQAKDKAEAQAAGFDHHLTKPVDPEALLQLLPVRPATLKRAP